MTMCKLGGQSGDVGQRLERKSRGQRRMKESCEGSQSPPMAIVLLKISPTNYHICMLEGMKLLCVFSFVAGSRNYMASIHTLPHSAMILYGGRPWNYETHVLTFQCIFNAKQGAGTAVFWYRWVGEGIMSLVCAAVFNNKCDASYFAALGCIESWGMQLSAEAFSALWWTAEQKAISLPTCFSNVTWYVSYPKFN
jgi:hypothetical protein